MNEEQKAWLALVAAIVRDAQNKDTTEAYDDAISKLQNQIEACPEPT